MKIINWFTKNNPREEKEIRVIFTVSLLLKAFNGLIEIFGGLILLFTGIAVGVISSMIQGELLEDPSDIVANFLQPLVPYLHAHSQLFAAIYFLSHGVIKISLVIGLLKNKLYAYPAALVFLSLFMVYQIYRFSLTGSVAMLFLTIFDLLVVVLVWHEYRLVKNRERLQA